MAGVVVFGAVSTTLDRFLAVENVPVEDRNTEKRLNELADKVGCHSHTIRRQHVIRSAGLTFRDQILVEELDKKVIGPLLHEMVRAKNYNSYLRLIIPGAVAILTEACLIYTLALSVFIAAPLSLLAAFVTSVAYSHFSIWRAEAQVCALLTKKEKQDYLAQMNMIKFQNAQHVKSLEKPDVSAWSRWLCGFKENGDEILPLRPALSARIAYLESQL